MRFESTRPRAGVRLGPTGRAALVCILPLLCGDCRNIHQPPPPAGVTESPAGSPERRTLLPVSLPDLSGMEPAMQAQVQGSFSSLMAKIATPGLGATELAAAYGAAGKLFMAAEELESAEPCFLNAAALVPGDARWPYYLGHLYKRSGDLDRTAASFERTVAVQPDNVAALWWLGSVRLELGQATDAEPLLLKALTLQPSSWQTLYALGRTSLLRRDYAAAAQYFERTLAVNPRATPVHYQLGLAYRGLGNLSEAEIQLRQHVEDEIRPEDPLMTELDGLLHTSVAYHSRAVEATKSGDWAKATEYFAKSAELDPRNAGARLDVGIALYRSGHAREAFEQVQEALRTSPRFARAHYVAGMLMVESGRDREAIDAFTAATTFDANFIEGYLSLAQALQRIGRSRDALVQYQEVLTRAPADSEGQFGSAVALIRLGQYQGALERFTEGANTHPDEPRFAHAMARLLAAAPDDRVRNGNRARSMAEGLLKADPTLDRAETLAMSFAELGQFEEAMAWQKHVIAELARAGRREPSRQLVANLRLYERHQPCRTPWSADDPIFFPRPRAVAAPPVSPEEGRGR
ncbi:MAG: hypothetical protein C5B57_05905 [Blastocatellia bacterium]|nr:MAG: hypothetical protein C5B57_05905 [Blastocatellia bacterium]